MNHLHHMGARTLDVDEVRRFFDGLAPTWADNPKPDQARLATILDSLGDLAGSRVLDVACGTGVLAPYLLERGAAHVCGVDLSSGMVESACARNLGEKVEFLVADACTAALPAHDACIVFNAIPHFADPARLFANVARSLSPAGALVVAHDASREQVDGYHGGSATNVSSCLLPAEEMARLMEAAGLVPVTVIDDDIYLVTARRPL